MMMSNSSLVDYVALSPNHSGRRTQAISKIAIHHTAGVLSVETIGRIFSGSDRQASSNYGIGYDGRVGMYVEEANRSWCTSSAWVDQRAATIECSNSAVGGDWPVSNHVLAKLVDLCVDICKRNNIDRVVLTQDKNGTLVMHKWFAATACPGPFLASKFGWIANAINARIGTANETSTSKDSYTVVAGDSLSLIERKLNGVISWQEIAKLNGISEPYIIRAGQVLRLSATSASVAPAPIVERKTVVVQKGDTLSDIARAWSTTWQDIAQLNKLANPSLIYVGQILSMPLDAKQPTNTNTPAPLKVGDKVRVTFGSKTYTGQSLADFVYRTTYTVLEISGDRVVIGIDGRVTAAIDMGNLVRA